MKTIVSSLTALAVFGSSLMVSSVATAEMSYNVGYVSEYTIVAFSKRTLQQVLERIRKRRFLCRSLVSGCR